MNEPYLTQFILYLKAERGYGTGTTNAYQTDLKQFIQFSISKKVNILEADFQFLRNFIAYLRTKNLSSRTVARKCSALKQFYKFMLREGFVDADPTDLLSVPVKEKKIPKHLTHEEINAISNCLKLANFTLRDRAMFEVWYATGVRITELAQLLFKNLDLKQGFILVCGKGNRERWVPLHSDCLSVIDEYIPIRHKQLQEWGIGDSPFLFLSNRARPLTRGWLWQRFKMWAAAAQIERTIWPHMIRHAFASHLLNGGADLRALQEWLGHQSIGTTEVYTHLDLSNLREVYEKYHPRS